MDAGEVTDVCRLCPSSGGGQDLINVFDTNISFKYNIREVIAMNTGIEILENDLISKNICQRCCNILYKMFEFRLDALKQDQKLKDKCNQYLADKGIKLPNTCITIKRERFDSGLADKKPKIEPDRAPPSTTKEELKKRLHPSVTDIYRNYPHLKLPTKCFGRHLAPVVSFAMGEVETYFKKLKLDMRNFIYKPATRTQLPQKVAKKKTTPTKQKIVAPLKISKKLLETRKKLESRSDDSYICTSIFKEAKGRKRKLSSSGSERSVGSKSSQKNQPKFQPVPELVTDSSKPSASTPTVNNVSIPISNTSDTVPKTSRPFRIESPVPADLMFEHSRITSPALADPGSKESRSPSPSPPADQISEDSRDSYSTNISICSTTSKPEFVESLGLTPTITATKSHTLLLCNLCGSVHHNAFELKRHTNRHMICQFCKLKFKSVEAKEDHVDNACEIKKIMNSPPPVVALEKIHLNLTIRKKYRNAFATFELIPGMIKPTPVEHVLIKEASPPPPVDEDDVIVLSDDDETSARSADPLSGIPTPSANMPCPAIEDVVYNTVSIVRPDIRIKNNTILNSLAENMNDKQLIKDLIELLKPQQPTTVEEKLQTDLPASKDIKINNCEGTCEFKNLKGQLSTYKIPVKIISGPFHVAYQFNDKSQTKKSMAMWTHLPVIDVCKETTSKPSTESKNASVSSPSSTCPKSPLVKISKVQSSNAPVSSVPVIITSITTNSTVALSSSSITPMPVKSTSGLVPVQTALLIRPVGEGTPTTQTLNIANINPISTSNSATPLLQNYALTMTSAPVISNPIPIPRTYINSALSNTVSTSNRTMSSTLGNSFVAKPQSPSVITSYNWSLPTSSPKVNKPDNNMSVTNSPNLPSSALPISTVPNQPPVSLCFTNIPSSTTTTTTVDNTSASTSGTNTSSTPKIAEPSKFRVKSVWELQ